MPGASILSPNFEGFREHHRDDDPDLRPEKSLIIVDGAVDELRASEQDRHLVLTLIANALARNRIPLVRFLICSRLEAHIEEIFDMKKLARAVVLDEKVAQNDDIRGDTWRTSFFVFLRNVKSLLSLLQHLLSKGSGHTHRSSPNDDDRHPKDRNSSMSF